MSGQTDQIQEALEASYHIAECGEHPEHLLAAENAARLALAALDALKVELARKDEALWRIAHAVRKPNGIITNEWFYGAVVNVSGIARAALAEPIGKGEA